MSLVIKHVSVNLKELENSIQKMNFNKIKAQYISSIRMFKEHFDIAQTMYKNIPVLFR